MTEADTANTAPPADSDPLTQMRTRTRKLTVAVAAVFAPLELVIAVSQSTGLLNTALSFGIIALLVVAFQIHTHQLTGEFTEDDHRVFHVLVHPAFRVLYALFGVGALGAAGAIVLNGALAL